MAKKTPPRMRDAVYDENRKPKQPNGVIIRIIGWGDEREYIVAFANGDKETYEHNQFEGYWTDSLGGYWHLM